MTRSVKVFTTCYPDTKRKKSFRVHLNIIYSVAGTNLVTVELILRFSK